MYARSLSLDVGDLVSHGLEVLDTRNEAGAKRRWTEHRTQKDLCQVYRFVHVSSTSSYVLATPLMGTEDH